MSRHSRILQKYRITLTVITKVSGKIFISKFTGGASEVVKKFEDSLNNFIEAISVMLITACVIPVLTFMVLLWLLRSVLQIDLQTPGFHELAGKVKINPYRIAGKAGERKQIEQ